MRPNSLSGDLKSSERNGIARQLRFSGLTGFIRTECRRDVPLWRYLGTGLAPVSFHQLSIFGIRVMILSYCHSRPCQCLRGVGFHERKNHKLLFAI